MSEPSNLHSALSIAPRPGATRADLLSDAHLCMVQGLSILEAEAETEPVWGAVALLRIAMVALSAALEQDKP